MKLRLGLIKRFLAGGTTLLAVLVMSMTGGATADAAALSAETPTGQAGSTVQVTGDGYVPLVSIGICWDEPGCDDLGSVQPGLQTGFTTDVTIPGSATPGEYQIHACQLLSSGLTCSSADFEVLASEPATTTTTGPRATTTAAPGETSTSTLSPTTTSSAPSTTITGATTLETPAPTPRAVTGNASHDVGGDSGRATEVVSRSDSLSTAGSTSSTRPTTTTTATTTTSPDRQLSDFGTYTPPTVSDGDNPQTGGEAEGPTIVLEAAGDTQSALSWLDDPLFFWTAWVIVVVVGGALASLAAWLLHRRRHES